MDSTLKSLLWRQMGASLDMLENAITACPEALWSDQSREPQVWYLVSHTLFWLDFYLTANEAEFAPSPPFGLEELDPAGIIPDRVYTKAELLAYLDYGRQKARRMIAAWSPTHPGPSYTFRWGTMSWYELQIYNLRHVQHGAAQLNLILRQEINDAPRWVGGAGEGLE
ncbi:MAG: DinB family protein [Candidatus Zixiibacteriota bacterium]|nr:MAG: DinB family protein [candidate division Zixibacteria bacterium]